MLKVIENKAACQRDLLVAHARRIFSSIPQPANLKFLAAGVAGSYLKLVKDGIPRIRIHAIEPDETRLHIMSRDGPLGLYCELTTLDRFVSTFPARPSGSEHQTRPTPITASAGRDEIDVVFEGQLDIKGATETSHRGS